MEELKILKMHQPNIQQTTKRCVHTRVTHTHTQCLKFKDLIEIPGTVDVEAMKEKEKENTTTFLGTFATLCKHYVCFCYCQLIVAQQSQGVFHNPTTCT